MLAENSATGFSHSLSVVVPSLAVKRTYQIAFLSTSTIRAKIGKLVSADAEAAGQFPPDGLIPTFENPPTRY
jgi:hypothetical protein